MLSSDVNIGIQFSPDYWPGADNGDHYMTIHSEEFREHVGAFADTVLNVVPQVYLVAETAWDGQKYYRKPKE